MASVSIASLFPFPKTISGDILVDNINSHLNRSKSNKYLKLLNNFDKIPDCRKSVNEQNLLWFIRNGAMLNSGHKDFFEALNLARELLNSSSNSNF